jgi:hypothetical protein
MAGFLTITPSRLEWASHQGIVKRERDGSYCPQVVTAMWLKYERGRNAKSARRSELEKARVRLTQAKAARAERQLALLDHALVSPDDIIERVKTVCLRIRNKMLIATPRIARVCYSSPSVNEAVLAARREFDVLLAELSALEEGGSELAVVRDDTNGKSG